ncbi:hypothetical protein [Nocardiopsis synnemataformans]|uniref:hypothetical protein n=1 Tax=Nocardiopsis synnemataformans TaxID=61305 RepID=UPI003EBCADD5
MTDNGGERRDSDAEDSWFKPSENRYRTQSDYQDPLEPEGTGDTVFPDSGGYAGLSSSRPAMVEPYPEALGGPPPPVSHGISYPGAGSSAYQPLTRVPGETEESSLPSVAASAQVPLPSEQGTDRSESWSDGPRTQEMPVLGDRDAPDAGRPWDVPSSAPGSSAAAEQPWGSGAQVDDDRGAPSWEAPSDTVGGARASSAWDTDAPARGGSDRDAAPWADSSGAAGSVEGGSAGRSQPWDAPASGASGQPWDDASASGVSGGRAWDGVPASGVTGGQPWDEAPVADRRDPLDDGLGTASWDAPASGAASTAGTRPWEEDTRASSAWDAHAPARDDRGPDLWADSSGAAGSVEGGSAGGSQPWDAPASGASGQPWDDTPGRSRDAADDGLGPASWEAPSSAASGQPWDEAPVADRRDPLDDGLGTASWDAPASGAASTAGARPWEEDTRASSAWDADAPAGGGGDRDPAAPWPGASGSGGQVEGAQPWDDAPVGGTRDPLDDGLGPASWEAPASSGSGQPWDGTSESGADIAPGTDDGGFGDSGQRDLGAWSAEAPVADRRDPLDDGLGPASWEAPSSSATGQPWDDAPVGGTRDPLDDGLGPASWETRSSPTDQPWDPDPAGDRGAWNTDRGGQPWESDARGSSGWDDDALARDRDRERGSASWTDVPGPDGSSWEDDAPVDRPWDDRAPRHGTGERGADAWDDRPYGDDDPLGENGARGRSWDDDELGGDLRSADRAPAGAEAPDAWAPSGRTDDRSGAGSGGSWGDGYGDELSPSGLGTGTGNTWAFDRNDPRLPDVVREAEQRRRESSGGPETVDWGGPDTGGLSAAVPGADDPLGAIADMQSRARSRDQDLPEDPGGATQMFDARALAEGAWEDDDEFRRGDRRGGDGAGYGHYDDDPDGPEYGHDGEAERPEPEYGHDDDPEPEFRRDDRDERDDHDDSEYEDGFTPADYGMPAAPAGRSRRRKDPIADDFPGFGDRPLGGEAGDAYPGYDSIDFLADTERGATLTLWLGVVSLLPGVGLVTAVLALLVTGPKAKRAIRESRGQLDGLGLITTGTVFAVIGILVTVTSVALWLVL